MVIYELLNCLERSPVIAAVRDEGWQRALESSAEIIFYLKADVFTVKERISQAKQKGKILFVHIDLAEGITKDKIGVEYLIKCGVDGIISTRSQLINFAKEGGILTVQRLFALDSQGIESMRDVYKITNADLLEIMPGVIPKVIEKFSQSEIPVIAGGLIETKKEVTAALLCGAVAVSTGKVDLWEI